MTTATVKHQCKHGCGYEHEKRGPMNLHELYHCPKIKAGTTPPVQQKKPRTAAATPAPKLKCDCNDGPTLAYLSKSNPAHVGAIAAGYKKICTECQEVFA